MTKHLLIPLVMVGMFAVASAVASAGSHGVSGCETGCSTCCAHDCGVQYVEKTIMVPTWETHMRRIMVTEYRTEPRERTRTVCRRVPVQVERTRTVCDRVPEICTRTVCYTEVVRHVDTVNKTYNVCKPVHTVVEKPYTAMVPYEVEHTGTRKVCKPYKEMIMCDVTRDMGHWDTQMVEVPVGYCHTVSCGGCGLFRRARCGGCGSCRSCSASCNACGCDVSPCGQTKLVERRVWVPNLVTEQVERPVVRTKWVDEEYTYTTVECRPETRTRKCVQTEYVTEEVTKTMNVVRFVPEQRTKEVQYTKYNIVPRTEKYMATVYKTETHDVIETVNVCVPVQVEKEVPMRVCNYVPKTITVPVRPCGRRSCLRCCR